MTHRLIYESEAAENVTDADFRMIAMFSRMANQRAGISGLLLHCNGKIMQVLEGPQESVKELYSKIENDKRHIRVKLLMDTSVEKPIFSEWSMGFRPVKNMEQMEAFFELSKNSLEDAIPVQADNELRKVIGEFARSANI